MLEKKLIRRKALGIIAALLLILGARTCWASPTGLNNIPTADVVGDKTLVLQGWFTAADKANPLWVVGFKYGILDRIELGLDSKVGSDKSGPVALQAKLKAIELDLGFSALVGVEGITLDGEITDNIVPYLVGTQDLKFLRLHIGYGFKKDDFGVFVGADKKFEIYGQDFIVRSDLKQTDDGDEVLASAGFLLTLPFNLALETWISVPSKSDSEESVTVKLNYIAKF